MLCHILSPLTDQRSRVDIGGFSAPESSHTVFMEWPVIFPQLLRGKKSNSMALHSMLVLNPRLAGP